MARFFRFMNILKMSMDMKCKCGSVIPEVRVNMGYDYRAGCIYVESDWGCPEEGGCNSYQVDRVCYIVI